MTRSSDQYFLLITAFFSGMVIMAVELTATRIMAPYFGTSVFVWTNLLGVVMMALAIGYWLGGKLGDRYPTRTWLFGLLLASSILLMLIPLIAPSVFDYLSTTIEEDIVSLVVNSLMGSLIIFAIPFAILGMISPSIVRLLGTGIGQSGSVAGKVFSASTIGSILGTFLPTLLLVPWIGSKRTIFLFSSILLIISLIGLRRKFLWFLGGAVWFTLSIFPSDLISQSDIVFQTESPYGFVWVVKDRHGTYRLHRDQRYGIQSVYNPDKVLTGGYWDQFIIAPFFQADKKHQTITVIGSAGGTFYRIWQELLKNQFKFRFEGAEIDPAVVHVSKKYLALNYPNLSIKTIDGRRYLRQSDRQFDVIVLDAYHNLYIPPHLTSLEFFDLVKSRLTSNGVMMANVHSWLNTDDVIGRIVRTNREVFKKTWVVEISSTNFMIVSTDGSGDLFTAIDAIPRDYKNLADRIRRRSHRIMGFPKVDLVTDDRPLSAILYDRVAIVRLLSEK